MRRNDKIAIEIIERFIHCVFIHCVFIHAVFICKLRNEFILYETNNNISNNYSQFFKLREIRVYWIYISEHNSQELAFSINHKTKDICYSEIIIFLLGLLANICGL